MAFWISVKFPEPSKATIYVTVVEVPYAKELVTRVRAANVKSIHVNMLEVFTNFRNLVDMTFFPQFVQSEVPCWDKT